MPESTQAQTQIQSNSNVKIIEVSKKAYNVIRSIVDSSTSTKYDWNKPVMINEKIVKFVKYKVLPNGVEVKAWEITIEPIVIQQEGLKLTGTVIKVYDGLGNEVADLTIRDEFTVKEIDTSSANRYAIAINDIIIGVKSIHEYEYYVIKPRSDVPYTKLISLADFVNKLMFFYSKALSVVKDGNAPEDDGI